MIDSEQKVNCGVHGLRDEAFVCQHLLKGKNLGFNLSYDPENPFELFPPAWCNDCDSVLDEEDEWNEKSESYAGIKLICSGCYQIIRNKNWPQENGFDELVSISHKFLSEKQGSFADEFKINDHEKWDWEQDTGKLIFSHNGKPQVEAVIHFSGSYSTASESWMWAWANNGLDEKVKESSKLIKEMGDEMNFLKLVAGLWEADEVDGWEMTAILAKAINAIGAYRTPKENGFTYMVVTDAKWVD